MTPPRPEELNRRSTDEAPFHRLAAAIADARVLLAATVSLGALIVAVYTARNDLANLKAGAVINTHALDSLGKQMEREHTRSNTTFDLVVSLARLQCRKFPDAAADAGFPCATLNLPLPER